MTTDNKKMPQAGEFCWNELMTLDPSKAKKFYTELFNWTAIEHDMGGVTYTMLKCGDKDIGGMLQTPKGQEKNIPPHWMSYVNVSNVDETVKKAKALGATIIKDTTPVADFGLFAILQDPTGAHLAVWQSVKGC